VVGIYEILIGYKKTVSEWFVEFFWRVKKDYQVGKGNDFSIIFLIMQLLCQIVFIS